MRVRTLAAVVAGLDVLLGVVPGTAGVRHEDRERKARHERTGEQAAEGIDIDEADDERHDHRKGAGDDHLLERRVGADGHAAGGVGHHTLLAFAQARNLPELAADLFDHRRGGATDSVDRERSEEEGKPGADEEADEDVDVTHVQAEAAAFLGNGELEALEEGKRSERSRADSEALGDSGSGVAKRIERIGDLADRRVEFGHLGDATRVVGDRPVGVDGDDDTGRCEHADCSNGDAIDPAAGAKGLLAAPVGDTHTDEDQGNRRGNRDHAGTDTGKDCRGRTSF